MGESDLERPRRSGFRRADAALLLLSIGAVAAFRHADTVARALHDALAIAPRSVWNVLWLIVMACLILLTYRVVGFMGRHVRGVAGILSHENAYVTVDFVLTFPAFLLLLAMIVQMALLANAALVVDYAAYSAARSAIVSIPMGRTAHASAAACTVLAPISPPAGEPESGVGEAIQPIFDRYGKPWAFSEIQARTAYAAQAATISVSPSEIVVPADVTVKIQYPFALRIPGAAVILTSKVETIAGVSGRFFRLGGTCTLRSTGAPFTEWWRMLVAFGDYLQVLEQMFHTVMALYELGTDTVAVIRGVGGGHVGGPGGPTLPVPANPGGGPPPGVNPPRLNLPYPPSGPLPPRPPPLPSAPNPIRGIRLPPGIRGLLPPASGGSAQLHLRPPFPRPEGAFHVAPNGGESYVVRRMALRMRRAMRVVFGKKGPLGIPLIAESAHAVA